MAHQMSAGRRSGWTLSAPARRPAWNFTRGEVAWLARYSDAGSLANSLCALIPSRPLQVVCAVVVGWLAMSLADNVRTAARYGQCVKLNFTYVNYNLVGWGR